MYIFISISIYIYIYLYLYLSIYLYIYIYLEENAEKITTVRMFILSLLIVSPYYIRILRRCKIYYDKKIIQDILEAFLEKLIREFFKSIILLRETT